MKKNKLIVSLLAAGCLAALPASADNVVKITTSKLAGETLTLQVNQAAGVTVDWGDGTPESVASTTDDLLTVSGELKGQTITLKSSGKLTTLVCDGQSVTALDLSGASNLLSLYCQNNSLTTLSLTGCPKLLDLNCSNNSLTTLDVTAAANSKLQNINVANNQLSSVDALKGTELQNVDVSGNNFTSLNLTKTTSVDVLKCNDNSISTVYLGTSPFTVIACGENKLSSLVISNKTNLTQLFAEANKLSTLDVSAAAQLSYLAVENNKLATIKYPTSRILPNITCENNRLTLKTLPSRSYVNNITYAPQEAATVDLSSLLPYKSINREKFYYLLLCSTSAQSKVSPYALDVADYMTDYAGVKANTYTAMQVTEDNPEGVAVESSNLYNPRKNGLVSFKTTPIKEVFIQFTSDSYPDLVMNSTPHFTVVASADDVTAVNDVVVGNAGLAVSAHVGTLTLTSQQPTAVKVYNAGGQQVWTGVVEGTQSLNLTKGVYVVNGQKVVL